LLSDRFATGLTVVPALALASAESGSSSSEVTVAWFVIDPGPVGWTLISTPAFPPFAIVPSAHVTVPLSCEQVPCVGMAESKVTPPGSASVKLTPVASCGPELCAVSV